MKCPVSDNQLWTLVLGEEENRQRADELAQHVAGCIACAQRTVAFRSMMSDLADMPPDLDAATALPPEGAIDGFRLIRQIGQGGMGTVFEAEQQSPQRRVALKVISAGQFANDFQIRLFQREMQTLAHLNHPGIAAIYNAGRTTDGQHYFAMELVEGAPLDEFVAAADAPLTIRQRLELFQRICDAVSYAHQRGVIHRDLKPGNILVTPVGDPKILDFGLARIADTDVPGSDIVTELGRILGTYAYMSPEQARGDTQAIDVRSDVYALGVILHEMLTGVRPYDVTACPVHETVRIICEERVHSPRGLNPSIAQDVGTITLHTLEKEPQRRYQSAAELADDVRRYLTSHPILARPPSRVYHLQKLLARHRLAFGLASLVFALVVGSAITFGVLALQIADQRDAIANQRDEITEQRDLARTEASKFSEVNAALKNMFTASNPWMRGDRDVLVRDVLDDAADRIERDIVDNPLVAAAARNALGNTYRGIGELERAEAQLTVALATRRELLGNEHLETVESLNDLGELRFEQGQLEAAEALFREVLDLQQKLLPPDDPAIANSRNSLGLVLKWQGDLESPEELFRQAQAVRESYAETLRADANTPRPRLVEAHEALAQTLNNLAALYRARATEHGAESVAWEYLESARPLYERALELRQTWQGPDHPQTAKMHNNIAHLLADLGDLAAAETHARGAARILEAALGLENNYTARAYYNLASLLANREKWEAARDAAQTALRNQEQLLPTDSRHIRATRALLDRIDQQRKSPER